MLDYRCECADSNEICKRTLTHNTYNILREREDELHLHGNKVLKSCPNWKKDNKIIFETRYCCLVIPKSNYEYNR